jgi:hypothetical protein
MVEYKPFDLLLSPAAAGYQVRVIESPSGQAAGTFHLPPAIAAQKANLALVGGAIRAFKFVEADPTAPTERLDPQVFGAALFTALFHGPVEQVLRRSLALVEQQQQGLRLRLRLDEAPELAALPWEYLYDPVNRRYLALSDQTPIVRYLALPQAEVPLAVTGPLRLLVLTADVKDYAKLNIAAEEARLRTALGALEQRGEVAVTWLPNGTLSALRQALRRDPVHIFHFIGHGWFTDHEENGLLLADEEGNGLKVSAETLGINLQNQRSLRLAFLNACEGARLAGTAGEPFAGVAQHLVQQGLPAVIAMQFPVTDQAAIELTREFYTAIADRYPVDRALTQARIAIRSQESVMEWGTPVLFLRAADGRLWQAADGENEQAVTTRSTQINTGGGAYIGGNISVSGEFVGRDKIVHGDEVKGDKVMGDKVAGDKISGHQAGGDVIVATVGAGARNVAVGKNIHQTVTETPGQSNEAEQQQIGAALTALLHAARTISDQRIALRAEVHIETLQEELTKSAAALNGGAVTNALAWLQTNAPTLAPAVNALLALPAVQQRLLQADAQTVAWWRRWLP